MVLVADAPWAVQEYDFQRLQWLWDGCCDLDRTEHRRAASCITAHRTDQRNHSAVQSPLQKSWVHDNWGTTADTRRQRTHRHSERDRRRHYRPIITRLKWLLNLLLSWVCCSCKRASELKKGITLAELCWSASVKAWQCFTIVVLARRGFSLGFGAVLFLHLRRQSHHHHKLHIHPLHEREPKGQTLNHLTAIKHWRVNLQTKQKSASDSMYTVEMHFSSLFMHFWRLLK